MSAPAPRLERRARIALDGYPVDAAWSADGRGLLVAAGEGALHWVDAAAPSVDAVRIGGHEGGALAVAWQGGGRQFASSGQDGEVRLWDARTRSARVIQAGEEWSEQLAFASHGRALAVATGRQLRIYGADGTLLREFPGQPGTITALAWRARTSELATVGNGGARLHRVDPAPQSRDYPWAGACLTACWSPDGRILASGMQDGSVHFWNIAAGTQSQMRGYGSKVTLTSWNAGGRLLATAAEQQIVLWNFSGAGPEGSEPLQLDAHTARLTQLAFQPQGPLLAAGARDHRLTLWRPAQAHQPCDAELLGDEVALLRWSNDGRRLAVADRGGTLSLYTLRQ